MPYQDGFNTKITADKGGSFINLKVKGDKVRFRLIAPPYYDGKHFIKEGEKWSVVSCEKIMTESYCEHCEKYYKLIKEAKEQKDKNTQAEKTNEARQYKVKITFYYPIVDREDNKGKVLKCPLLIRIKIDNEVANGIDVLKYDYVMNRTEKPGNDYYSLTRMDSVDSKPLTKEEKIEGKKALEIVQSMKGEKSSDQELGREKLTENINPDDIPF
jgi:hypothetical protein